MFFLLQKEYSIDTLILKEMLDAQSFAHQYLPCSLDDFNDNKIKEIKNAIPIGTIEFVTAWFNKFTHVKQMNPIEVPICLRTNEFLKRKYSIVSSGEIPKTGHYFIKDASQLKVFSYCGDMEHFLHNSIWNKPDEIDSSLHLNPNHLFQVSEVVKILSEYRVYIINGEIQAIANYDGDPCIFPDANLIKKANFIYSMQPDYPKSYTMDIMVTDKGTAIIEAHVLFSCGLYNLLFGNNLMYGYRDSKDYLLDYNTEPTKFSNF